MDIEDVPEFLRDIRTTKIEETYFPEILDGLILVCEELISMKKHLEDKTDILSDCERY